VGDKFTGEFNLILHVKKSRCLTFKTQENLVAQTPRHYVSPLLLIGGNNIENVSLWSHLGCLLNVNLRDDDDILTRRNSLIG